MNTLLDDPATEATLPEAWMLGHELFVEAVFDPKNDRKSIKDITQSLGIFACTDGVCDGVCAHSMGEIRRLHSLVSDDDIDFVDGVKAAQYELGLGESYE